MLEKTLESLLDSKEIQPVNPKGKSVMNIHWKDWTLKLLMQRADLLENTLMLGRLKGEEGDDRGWVDWMASPTQWTCCCSVAGSCLSLCNPIDYSTPGFHVLHHLPELAQMHVHYSFHFWKFNLDLLYFLFNFGNIVIKKHFLILNY